MTHTCPICNGTGNNPATEVYQAHGGRPIKCDDCFGKGKVSSAQLAYLNARDSRNTSLMQRSSPSNAALLVNNLVNRKLDAGPALRSLEDRYGVGININHCGASVVRQRGNGDVAFSTGNWQAARGTTKAVGIDQVTDMRVFIIELLFWASENMPTPQVSAIVYEISGGDL